MQKWRTGGQPPAATVSVCGHHIKGETVEMTDSVDTTDTTTNTTLLNPVVADASLPTSHSLQEDNRSRKEDTRSSQELSSMQQQEVISREDASLTTTDAQTGTESGCADSEMGCTETTETLKSVGYKREHSHSPCSRTSPLQSPTTACRAIGCIVEPEQELVVNGEASRGGQREERQPRKRVKRETMEEGREREGSNGRK